MADGRATNQTSIERGSEMRWLFNLFNKQVKPRICEREGCGKVTEDYTIFKDYVLCAECYNELHGNKKGEAL
jgi:hypothetical protein